MVEGTGGVVGKARTEGLKQLLFDVRLEFSKEDVAVRVVLDSYVEGRTS